MFRSRRLPVTCWFLLLTFTPAIRAEATWFDSLTAGQAAAVARQVPLYLHLGDPLHELTGAMARQTFANPEVTAFLQRNFVCVRLDRDAEPGLAAYGQQWLAADQKLPGWPLNLWFTPALEPIEAASYLPPTEEWGREGFMVVAQRIAERWTTDPAAVSRRAAAQAAVIADHLPFAAVPPPDLEAALAAATDAWLIRLDARHGTFGDPPHAPEPELLRFLLARGGDARTAALQALRTRLASPLHDPLDGGFYRATADSRSAIPVFQKRLTDQARLALACLDAAAVSDDPLFAAAARSALDYAINRLSPAGDGIFVVGEDATTPDATAAQTWTWQDLTDHLGATAATALGARPSGNVDPEEDLEGHHQGRNILRASPLALRSAPAAPLAPDQRAALLATRTARAATRIDQTATAAAHALLLHALQRSASQLDDAAHRAQAAAITAALQSEFAAGTPAFSRLADRPVPATAEDVVLTALALGDLALAREADARFFDASLGLYSVTAEPVLGIRPLWWSTGATELPSPMVWRVLLGEAPAALVRELTLPFENPDLPPSGATLLALQQTLE